MTFNQTNDVNSENEERSLTMSDEEKLQDDANQHEIHWKEFYDESGNFPENAPLSDEELEKKLSKFDEECEEIARLHRMKSNSDNEEDSSESSTASSVCSCEHLKVPPKVFFKRLDRSNSTEATVKLEDLDDEGEHEIYVRKEEEITLKDCDDGNKDYRELLKWNIELPPTNRVMLLPIQRKIPNEEESDDEKSEEEWREFTITPNQNYQYQEEPSELVQKFDKSDDIVTKYMNTDNIEKPDGTKVDNTVIMAKSISEIRARMAEFRKSLDDFNEKYKAAAAEIFRSYNDSLPMKMPSRIESEIKITDPKIEETAEKRKKILAYINKDLSDPEESRRGFEHIREMLKMIAVNAEDYEKSRAQENNELETVIEECLENENTTCSLEMKLAKMDQ